MSASPIIKWVGGKTKLLAELLQRAPKKFGHYYEPFFGGGSLFFALEPEKATLGDMNSDLVWMYREVAQNVEAVIEELTALRAVYQGAKLSRARYDSVRQQWNDGVWKVGTPAHAAAFIFLNKTCYNGLWRVNRKGGFNVPQGAYKNPTIFDPEDMRAAAKVLKQASINYGSFDETTCEVKKGDLVYFDPPYDPVTKTSNFTSYTKDKFGDAEQEKLAKLAVEMERKGAFVMLSNNDTKMVRNLYKGFRIDVVQCTRPINSKGSKRGAVNEVIITSQDIT